MTALAYANWGRWVADCPRPHCGSAEGLELHQPWFRCTDLWCHAEAPVAWPDNPEEITAVLARRGAPKWMNWYPDGHPLAVRHGLPHGQSAADLAKENMEHVAELVQWHGPAINGGARVGLD